jgi:2-phospho-L-lactate guanylyltransferase
VTTGVIVPVRGFATGKARLSTRLTEAERAALLESMAGTVVAAAGPRPVVVVTSAPEVREWANDLGAAVIDDPGSLNGAADAGRAYWQQRHATRVVIVHADLPHARSLDAVDPLGSSAVPSGVLAVACHRRDGTPALSLPADAPFVFAYGPGSFALHRAEAERCGLPFAEIDDDGLCFDVDTVDDLASLVTPVLPTTP